MARADRRWLPVLALLAGGSAAGDVVVTEGTNLSVDVAADGRLVIDLLGGLRVIPAAGGDAVPLPTGERGARAPRWSRDGERIVYEVLADGLPSLRILDVATGTSRPLGDGRHPDRTPAWHPDGKRVIFSSRRGASGFDLWEADVGSTAAWQITDLPGDESEPAWSADGQHLVYVHEYNGRWSLVLKRAGYVAESLAVSDRPIRAPSWRPDGSLVTWLAFTEGAWQVNMTILSEPRLTRMLMRDQDFFLSPIAWANRQQMIYTADGLIRTRRFDAWSSQTLPFRANIGSASGFASLPPQNRTLPPAPTPDGRRILRVDRVWDGLEANYRNDVDVVIDGGTVAAIEPRRPRDDGIVIDLGDATVLPGYVDVYARLPDEFPARLGPALLALGVTTLVIDSPRAGELAGAWADPSQPGPRVLRASALGDAAIDEPAPWLLTVGGDPSETAALRPVVREWQGRGVAVLADSWQAGLGAGATLVLGTANRPTSPKGIRYQDVQLASGIGSVTFVSGLADALTPGIDALLDSRAARLVAPAGAAIRPFAEQPEFRPPWPTLVAGSRPNGLPPGLGLHAELRAMAAAGLPPREVLQSAGLNAATVLGAGFRLGRIATGSAADLVIVTGDPLADVDAAAAVIAVVRNGRFYSASGLLDRALAPASVE